MYLFILFNLILLINFIIKKIKNDEITKSLLKTNQESLLKSVCFENIKSSTSELLKTTLKIKNSILQSNSSTSVKLTKRVKTCSKFHSKSDLLITELNQELDEMLSSIQEYIF